MAKFNTKITNRLQRFIEAQKIFFVATVPENGRINLSPKEMDSLRIGDKNTILWLNITGSAQTSCGMLIPFFDYKRERDEINKWSTEQGKEKIEHYWEDRNQTSIDGLPTKILE